MSTRLFPSCAACAALLAAAAAPARAQAPALPAAQPSYLPYYQTIAINALGLPFGLFSAEYERAISGGFSAGVGGSYLSTGGFGNVRGWAEAKALYYPNEVALSELGVGLTAGFISARDAGRSETGATLGVIVDYNLLLGPSRRFLVGAGVGARRVLGDVDDSPLNQVYLDGRLVIGISF